MMHYSKVIYQNKDQKKKFAQQRTKNQKKHIKSMGTYFEAPLIQKTLSTKPIAYRNVFRSIVQQYAADNKKQNHFLDLTHLQNTTMKTMFLQKQSKSNKEFTKAFRRHYRVDIKQYLKRKYRKNAYQLPLQAFELLRYVDQKDEQKPWDTKFIYIFKPFYINDNLKRRIQCNNQMLKQTFMPKNLHILFKQLLKCSVEFGGLDNFIMTTSNVYMEESFESLQINYTSFTGLGLLKCKSSIGAHEYFEVIPYFTLKMIEKGQIGYEERVRFFLINCLCLMTKRDFIMNVDQQVQAQKQFTYQQCYQKVTKQRFRLKKQFQQQISSIKQKKAYSKIKIKDLLYRGLVQQKTISWHQIASSICIGENYSKNPELEPNAQYAKKIQNAFRKFHLQLYEADPEKDWYKERNLESQLLYIPIKYRADLNLVFAKKVWWEIFNIKDVKGQYKPQFYNIFHENFCFRLLEVALRKYEVLDINMEQAKKFESDQVIQIIFNYLNISELPCLIIKQEGNKGSSSFVSFNNIYNRYMTLKQKIKGVSS